MDALGIGLAGLGRWGRRYLSALSQLPGVSVVAGADPDPLARSAAGFDRMVADFPSLLENKAVAAVVIATPPSTHYALARAALESGRDVLVEKPMAATAAEAAELEKLARTRGRILAVGHTALYSTDFARLRCRLGAGRLGFVRRAVAVRTSAGRRRIAEATANCKLQTANCGLQTASCRLPTAEVLHDLASHDVAMALTLFGPVCAGRFWSLRSGAVRYALDFASGTALDGLAAWRPGPHSRRFTVLGAQGVDRVAESPTANCKLQTANCPQQTPLWRQCRDFVACCRNRCAPLSSAGLGAAVVEVLERLTAPAGLQTASCKLPS